ncbi:MAG: hypothetical protein KQI35_08505 [Bacteroidetes bacterium]|nr:hypothetical protein [Bacteroidota bacterium]
MKIKHIILAIILVFSGILHMQGQDNPEFRYLLGGNNGKVNVSGFGAYTIGFSQVDGNLAVYNGGGGAVLLNQTVYFGLYGTGLSTRHYRKNLTMMDPVNNEISYTDLVTNFGHGGLWIGYIHESHKPVHFGASTKIGWGGINLTNDYYDNNYDTYDYYSVASDNVFVLTPQIEVEMNLLRWFKINAAAGYQIVTGINSTYVDSNGEYQNYFESSDFNQPVFNLTFVFGGFGGKRN